MRLVSAAVSLTIVLLATPARPQTTPPPLPPLPAPSSELAPEPLPTAQPPTPPERPPTPRPQPEAAPAAPTPVSSPGGLVSPTPQGTHRDALYLRVSLGPTFLSASGDGPAGSTSINGGGLSLAAALGGAITKGFALAATFRVAAGGGTWNGYANYSSTGPSAPMPINTASAGSTSGGDAIVQLGILADWYPATTGGWHLGGSFALSALAVSATNSNQSIAGSSAGCSVFGGYDWRIGGKWSLGVMGVAGTMGRSSLEDSNRNDSGYSMMPLFLGVEGAVLFF